MAAQTLTSTTLATDGTGTNLTALLAAPTATAVSFQNTLNTILVVSAGAAITTTVASGSTTGEISTIASWSFPSAGVLDVASSASFPASGTVIVTTSTTPATVTYTGTGSGTLTGCAYVSGSAAGTVTTTTSTVTLVSETVTVNIEALIEGQSVTAFPAVTLTASDVYTFGPFHSVLDAPGGNTMQVSLSSISNVTLGLITIPGVY
jgi:hypothetical protein